MDESDLNVTYYFHIRYISPLIRADVSDHLETDFPLKFNMITSQGSASVQNCFAVK